MSFCIFNAVLLEYITGSKRTAGGVACYGIKYIHRFDHSHLNPGSIFFAALKGFRQSIKDCRKGTIQC
jgi:hypothetical protein